jgi:hypothetical protein
MTTIKMIGRRTMSDDTKWYFCLRHQRVEHGPGCPDRDRMGPYATENEAANALQHARERNEQWEAQDDD